MPVIVASGTTRTVVVTQSTSNTQVGAVSRGPQGPQGPQGLPGLDSSGAMPAVTFSYGDASPSPILTTPSDTAREITLVSFQVEEAFNGTGASISLGISGFPSLLMSATSDLLSTVGVYEFSPRVELPTSTPIILTITPGSGASSGSGQFVLNTSPTT